MLKTSIFKIQVNCPGCNMYHTVTSINETEVCQNCGKNINLGKFFKSRLLGSADRVKYMNAFVSGSVEQVGGAGGLENVGSYKLSYSSSQVYCEECFEFIEETDLLESIRSNKPVRCAKCGHCMPMRTADNAVKNFHPKAIAVVNDSAGIDESEKNADKESMIVFKCMSCGAGLELNKDTGRTIKCNYCSNENYLPDAIWTKLHPGKDVCPLYVILDIDGNEMQAAIDYFLYVTMMKIYDRHFENFIREYFEKPFESDAVNSWFRYFLSAKNNTGVSFNMDIEKIQRSFYGQMMPGYENHNVRLREIASEYGYKLPFELQMAAAKDNDEKVRISLAKNPALNKEVINMLKQDASPGVASEAKKQKTGFFKNLFG